MDLKGWVGVAVGGFVTAVVLAGIAGRALRPGATAAGPTPVATEPAPQQAATDLPAPGVTPTSPAAMKDSLRKAAAALRALAVEQKTADKTFGPACIRALHANLEACRALRTELEKIQDPDTTQSVDALLLAVDAAMSCAGCTESSRPRCSEVIDQVAIAERELSASGRRRRR